MTTFLTPCRKGTASHPSAGGPPSPCVHFFGCQLHPMARYRSPYKSSSAPTVSTMASSLGISWCSDLNSYFFWICLQFSYTDVVDIDPGGEGSHVGFHLILAVIFSWLVFISAFIPTWSKSLSSHMALISASRHVSICSISAMWRYNYTMQSSNQSHFWHTLSQF
jgi:hypothetical protein